MNGLLLFSRIVAGFALLAAWKITGWGIFGVLFWVNAILIFFWIASRVFGGNDDS